MIRITHTGFMAMALLLLSLASPLVNAAPLLWKVTGESGGTLYLAGSVRALPESAYPLDEAFQQAYAASELMVFETNLKYLQDLEMQSKIGLAASYEQGSTTLKQEIPAELYERLARLMGELGVPMFTLSNYHPWMAGVLAEMAVFADAQYWPEKGLDKHFHALAREDGKQIKSLSSAEEYAGQLTSMSPAQSQAMLSLLLDDMERFRGEEQALVEYWVAGDADGLDTYIAEQKQAYPELYDKLLVAANTAWAAQLKTIVDAGTPAMAVIGAHSVVGPQGLLVMLEQAGYSVQAVE